MATLKVTNIKNESFAGDQLYLKSDGTIGIGTASPGHKLVISQTNSGGIAAIHLPVDESTILGPNANTYLKMGGNVVLGANGQLDVTTSGTSKLTIKNNGQVAIGSSSPDSSALISIIKDTTEVLADNEPLYNNASPAFLTIYNSNNTGTGEEAGINLVPAGNANGAISIYGKKTGSYSGDLIFRFRSGASTSAERLRIDSSGQFSLGRANQISANGNSSTSVFEQLSNSNYPLALHSAQTNKRGLAIFYATTGAGNAGDPFIVCTDNTNNKFQVTSDGTTTIRGNLVIATADKGIDFSGSQTNAAGMTSETLNSYEEGTWTPAYQNVSVTTYGHQSGRYTKIGRLVYCVGQITVDGGLDTSDGSAVAIGGLPFTGNSAHQSAQVTLGKYTSILTQASLESFTNANFAGTLVALLDGNENNLPYTGCNATGILQFAITYAL